MKITLPIIEKKYDELTEEVIVNKSSLEVTVNNNFQAHLKYEELFQKETDLDLTSHLAKITSWLKDEHKIKTKLLDMLKVLFCFIDSKELPSFNEFLGILETENAETIVEKISKVIELTNSTATKN